MTPAQMLRRQVQAQPQQVCEVEQSTYVPPEVSKGVHYTSAAMEEDFSISVELLMNSIGFLEMIAELDNFEDFLSVKARAQLDEQIEQVQDFLGQWKND